MTISSSGTRRDRGLTAGLRAIASPLTHPGALWPWSRAQSRYHATTSATFAPVVPRNWSSVRGGVNSGPTNRRRRVHALTVVIVYKLLTFWLAVFVRGLNAGLISWRSRR